MELDLPPMFRCPISMEIMENPVTIATGVTYERRSIEKWFFTYKKTTCPATMQPLDSFELIPNNTLKSIILSWSADDHRRSLQTASSSSSRQLELASILSVLETTPFKVNSLKKLSSIAAESPSAFLSSGGVDALCRVLIQSKCDADDDFVAFRACEEALGVLHSLPFDQDAESVRLLSRPEAIEPMLVILQRGSAEARLHAMSVLERISKLTPSITEQFHQVDTDVFKSLLDLLTDEVSPKLSSSSLDLLLEAIKNSKANRLKAIEDGAVSVLIELLPDGGRHRREKTLLLLKKLCERPEGRSAFADHGMGIAAVASMIGRECDTKTNLGVKILSLVSSFLPSKEVVDRMMACGAVKRLLCLIHTDIGQSSTKAIVLGMMRMHGDAWRRYSCYPSELLHVRY